MANAPRLPALPVGEWIGEFLQALSAERQASHHTVKNYEIDLRRWHRYLVARYTGVITVTVLTDLKEIRAFLAGEMEVYERSTVNRRLSVIKGFLKFLHREGRIQKNVARLIRLPRPAEKLPTVLRPDQIARLIDGIPTETLRTLRIRAVLELLYSTGIRVSELASLTHGDVNLRSGFVTVQGKGDKERVVPLGRHCQAAIRAYIDSVPPLMKRGEDTPLFQNRFGGAVSVRTIQRNLREFAIEILGDEGTNVTPHTFRHSCATHLLAGGAGLREIQELLGHRSLMTTQKYTQVDREQLKRSYRKAHPRARGKNDGKDRADG